MNNNRFLKIVIIVLILINLGTLGFIWFRTAKSDTSIRRSVAAGFLVKELDLSDAQRKEYFRMRRNHRITLWKLEEADQSLHSRFFNQLFSETPDLKMVHDLADSIAANRKKMELLTYEHFMHVRQILTPGQQEKFEKIFDEVISIVLPPPPPPPAPLPPPPPIPSE